MESLIWSENTCDDPDRYGLIMVDHEISVVEDAGGIHLIYEATPGFGWTDGEGDLPSGPTSLEEAIDLLEDRYNHCKKLHDDAERILSKARTATSFENITGSEV